MIHIEFLTSQLSALIISKMISITILSLAYEFNSAIKGVKGIPEPVCRGADDVD